MLGLNPAVLLAGLKLAPSEREAAQTIGAAIGGLGMAKAAKALDLPGLLTAVSKGSGYDPQIVKHASNLRRVLSNPSVAPFVLSGLQAGLDKIGVPVHSVIGIVTKLAPRWVEGIDINDEASLTTILNRAVTEIALEEDSHSTLAIVVCPSCQYVHAI